MAFPSIIFICVTPTPLSASELWCGTSVTQIVKQIDALRSTSSTSSTSSASTSQTSSTSGAAGREFAFVFVSLSSHSIVPRPIAAEALSAIAANVGVAKSLESKTAELKRRAKEGGASGSWFFLRFELIDREMSVSTKIAADAAAALAGATPSGVEKKEKKGLLSFFKRRKAKAKASAGDTSDGGERYLCVYFLWGSK